MLELNIDKDFFLPNFYDDLFNYSHRVQLFYGGRGSGKTVFCIQKLLLKGLQEKRNILLMRKETNKLRDSVWKELLDAIDGFKLTPYFEFNKTEFRAVCKINGTVFKCLGLDEAEKIKGYSQASDAYLDELTAFTQDDFELIEGTIRSDRYKLPLQIIGSFNPVSKTNWVYKYFGFDTDMPNVWVNHSTYLTNTHLSEDYRQRMEELKKRNFNRWKVEALGEFVTLDKLIYTNWRKEEFDEKTLNGTHIFGLDFGYTNDPTALVCAIVDEDKLYIFNEWTDTGKTNQEIASVIKSLGLSKEVIVSDSAEQKSIEEIRRAGVPRIIASVKGPDSIIHGIQKLQQYDIIVHPRCEQVITELENYAWTKDKTTGEYTNKPVDTYNHCLDALRYAIQQVGKGKIKTLPKSALGL